MNSFRRRPARPPRVRPSTLNEMIRKFGVAVAEETEKGRPLAGVGASWPKTGRIAGVLALGEWRLP
jgi:hypothetical protein